MGTGAAPDKLDAVVLELHLDLVFGKPRQLGREDEGLIGLMKIDRWRPYARPSGALLALGAAKEVAKQTAPVIAHG
jgi:hypothetical protein